MNERTSRRCYISIIGSQRHVAEALYVCSLPKMDGFVTDIEKDGKLGASPFSAFVLTPQHIPLFSLESIAPVSPVVPRLMRCEKWGAYGTTYERDFALDHNQLFTLPNGKQARVVSVHIGTEFDCFEDDYPKAALLKLSARCPNVLIACLSHDDGDLQATPRAAGFFQGTVVEDVAFTAPIKAAHKVSSQFQAGWSGRRYLMNDSHAANAFSSAGDGIVHRWIAESFSKPAHGRAGQVASALLATWSPVLTSCNEGGPVALSQMVNSARFTGRDGNGTESIKRFFVGCTTASGFGIMDAALASPIKRFAKRNLKQRWAAWNEFIKDPDFADKKPTAVCCIDPERARQLAVMCADDGGLAALVGSDAGYLASGMHVIALMARLATPGSAEDIGVRRILECASFRFPDPQHAALALSSSFDVERASQIPEGEIGPLHTLISLAASGNSHAWEFLLTKNDCGVIRGFTREFMARTVLATEELPLWLSVHGTREIRALVNSSAALNKKLLEALESHELAEDVRGQMRTTLSSPLQRPSQTTQPSGVTP